MSPSEYHGKWNGVGVCIDNRIKIEKRIKIILDEKNMETKVKGIEPEHNKKRRSVK